MLNNKQQIWHNIKFKLNSQITPSRQKSKGDYYKKQFKNFKINNSSANVVTNRYHKSHLKDNDDKNVGLSIQKMQKSYRHQIICHEKIQQLSKEHKIYRQKTKIPQKTKYLSYVENYPVQRIARNVLKQLNPLKLIKSKSQVLQNDLFDQRLQQNENQLKKLQLSLCHKPLKIFIQLPCLNNRARQQKSGNIPIKMSWRNKMEDSNRLKGKPSKLKVKSLERQSNNLCSNDQVSPWKTKTKNKSFFL